jgi:hypothetical protein
MVGEDQRESILKVIGINDYYRYKTKEKIIAEKKNTEEIDIDFEL